MLRFPARIKSDSGQYAVSFRDIPEAITWAKTREEALALAGDALATAMDFYFEDNRQVPKPSDARRGEVLVELPASISAKVLLLNEMIAQHVTAAELARRLSTSPQAVNRIVDIKHPTKIDTIAEALGKIGRRLELSVAP